MAINIKNDLRVFVATAALLSGAAVAFPQGAEGVVQGTVTAEEGGAGLADAVIKMQDDERGRSFSTKTGKDGRFYKRNIPGATYQFMVEKEGYKPLKETLRVASGVEHRFNFKLAKAAPEGAKEFAEGFAAFARGDNEAAVKAFEAAALKAPELPEVHVNLALAYLRVGRTADAVAKLEQAATLAPDQPRTLFQLGGAYVEMRDLDKAIAAFEKGLEKQPDLTNTLAYEATVALGAVYFAKGENEKSIAQFEKALAVKPGLPVPTLGLAKAYLSKGEGDKALELFKQVVATAPGTPEAAQAEVFVGELQKAKPPGS
jgi:tetratricopeptide (TPR) repeat protein